MIICVFTGFASGMPTVSTAATGSSLAERQWCIPRRNRSLCPGWFAVHMESDVGAFDGPLSPAVGFAPRLDATYANRADSVDWVYGVD